MKMTKFLQYLEYSGNLNLLCKVYKSVYQQKGNVTCNIKHGHVTFIGNLFVISCPVYK